jgi:uncharacterized protein (TIGR02145 family)
MGLIDIQKNAFVLGKTYKLQFTINQTTSKFFKVNLYHSNESAIIQYSTINTGETVNVLCLITPIVSDNETNKPLRITLSNVEVEVGDTIEIKDFTLNEVSTDSRYFKKEFRYSIDAGLNFTGWQDLNNVNVQSIVVSRRDQFLTEIKLTRTGMNPTGELVFNSLNIQGQYKNLPYPLFLKTFFSEFFTVNDIGVLNWQTNVLEKLYKTGIMPWYVERDTGEEDAVVIPPPKPIYTISSSVVGGYVNEETITVEDGDSVSVAFTPDENFIFSDLLVNGQPYNNYNLSQNGTLTVSFINVKEDKNVSVVYVEYIAPPTTYTISSSVVGGTANNSNIIVEEGDDATVIFTPSQNFFFVGLLVNGQPFSAYIVNIDNTITINFTNVQENKNISVKFVVSDYGLLYNWFAVNESSSNGGFIDGFTIPTDPNIVALRNHLGGQAVSGGKLKSTRTFPDNPPRWDLPNVAASDQVNFLGLPGGRRSGSSGGFGSRGSFGSWWTTLQMSETNARYFQLWTGASDLGLIGSSKWEGHSVRCVRPLTTPEQSESDGTYLSNVFDADGNEYRVVKIGSLAWTVEDLRTTKFANGTPIPNVTSNSEWRNLTTGAYCVYVE